MKKLAIIVAFLGILASCDTEPSDTKQRKYTFEIHYIDRTIDTLEYTPNRLGPNHFILDEGDIKNVYRGTTVVSYVKHFRVINIDTLK